MRSIKPGRGNSAMGAFGSLISVGFGIVWTIMAFAMTKDLPFPFSLFPLFGIFFIVMGIGQVVFNYKNATGENRYSSFDLVDNNEEPDPLNERFGNTRQTSRRSSALPDGNEFCPYCGKDIEKDFEFCPKCGRTLPD